MKSNKWFYKLFYIWKIRIWLFLGKEIAAEDEKINRIIIDKSYNEFL